MNFRWFILLAVFVARCSLGFQFQSVASISPFLVGSLHLSYAQIGTLIGLFMLPGVVVSVPGGMLSQRFQDKYVCALGLFFMIAGGLILGIGNSFTVACAGRLISGAGLVIASLVFTKMIADWFVGREIITAMGVMLASWPCGIAAGLVIQPPIAAAYGWSIVMFLTAITGALALILILSVYRPTSEYTAGTRIATRITPPALALRDGLACVTSGAIWGLFNAALVIFFSFEPAVLVQRGLTMNHAGWLVSLSLWVSTLSVPFGGYMTERIGRPNAAIMLFPAIAGGALMLLPLTSASAPATAALCVLIGAAIGPPAGAILALPANVLAPELRAKGLGIFYITYYAVMASGPAVAGAIREHWATADVAILFGAAVFWTVPLIFLGYRHIYKSAFSLNPTPL